MKHYLSVIVAIVCVASLGITGLAPAGGAKKKKTEVEGSWKLAKGGKGAPTKIQFSGNKFILTFPDDRVFKGTFKLNTNENPSWMDMKFESGTEDKYNGKVALCIYKFDGDGIVWCASAPGRKRRSQQFAETMGDARLLLGSYKKDKQ